MSKIEVSSLELKAGFRAPVGHIFEAFTNEGMMSGYTQSPCKLDVKEGGAFSQFGGSVTGEFTKITKPSELQMKWRFKEWDSEHYSLVTIKFEPLDSSSTKLTLTQTNIPHADKFGHHGVVEKVTQGWDTFFFQRIQKILGYAKLEV